MKTGTVVGMLLAVGLLAGCAKGIGTWTRAAAPPSPQDRFECMQAASYPRQIIFSTVPVMVGTVPVGGGTYGGSRLVTDPKLYGACMEAKGYSRVDR